MGPGGSINVIALELLLLKLLLLELRLLKLLYLTLVDLTFVVAPNASTSFFVPLGCLRVLSCISLFHKSNAVSKNTCSWSDGVSNRFWRDTVVKSS